MTTKTNWLPAVAIHTPDWCLCLSQDDFDRAAKEIKLKDAGKWLVDGYTGTTHRLERKDGSEVCVICIDVEAIRKDKYDPIRESGLLLHEVIHLWQAVEEGMNDVKSSKEFEAYSIQNLYLALAAEYRDKAFSAKM